jgi:hypothetical protein
MEVRIRKTGGAYFENIQQGVGVRYTIYYDSDFYNSDFSHLWSGVNGGRDDLRRFQQQLNVNFVHLYDWITTTAFTYNRRTHSISDSNGSTFARGRK